jgi:hypothetical protein
MVDKRVTRMVVGRDRERRVDDDSVGKKES